MRVLICTQAVDRDDTDLGFFIRWIEEIAKESEHVLVVCLRKGAHSLPANVEVISLGERYRLLRALEVCTIAFGRRHEYDAVFVHMNPEYIVAAGWLWRLLHKRIVLWYTHKSVNAMLRIASVFANDIFTASKESFRLASPKIKVVGHGIDTDFFAPDKSIPRGTHVLSAGRLTKSKNHDLIIRAAKKAGRALRIAGEGSERATLEKVAHEEGGDVTFLGGLTQTELRDEYRKAAHFVHASTTGSMDKVVLEAVACDCNVITTTHWLKKYFPVHSVDPTPEAIADAIRNDARESLDRVDTIRRDHSLSNLIPKIMQSLQS